MADALDTASRYLSENLSELRRVRSLSQSALARLAGLPRSTVTHVESGSGNPSLRNLIKLAGALQVSIEELLTRPRAEVHLAKAAALPCTRKSGGLVCVTQLLPDPIPGMSIDRVEMEAGARLIGSPHVNGSKEYITLIHGSLEISVADQKHRMSKGDVLSYPGDQTHRYENIGGSKLTYISVVVLAPVGL